MTLDAYIPCRNNAQSLGASLRSLAAQRPAPRRILVVDDGSVDGSGSVARGFGAEVIRHENPLGRGAARAAAMRELDAEWVLCVDGTNALDPDFMRGAMEWTKDPRVASVHGRLTALHGDTAAERWKDRHLFKAHLPAQASRRAGLSTWGALMRTSAVRACGGFNAALTHSEDADLGARLLSAGFDVVHDPSLLVRSVVRNTGWQVLERHWRWYVGSRQTGTARFLAAQARVGWGIFLPDDIGRRDPGCALLSCALPFACAWHSLTRRP